MSFIVIIFKKIDIILGKLFYYLIYIIYIPYRFAQLIYFGVSLVFASILYVIYVAFALLILGLVLEYFGLLEYIRQFYEFIRSYVG